MFACKCKCIFSQCHFTRKPFLGLWTRNTHMRNRKRKNAKELLPSSSSIELWWDIASKKKESRLIDNDTMLVLYLMCIQRTRNSRSRPKCVRACMHLFAAQTTRETKTNDNAVIKLEFHIIMYNDAKNAKR